MTETNRCTARHPEHPDQAQCTISARTVHNMHQSGPLMWADTETTNRCAAEMNGERCHFLIWHTGAHRSEHHDWPREAWCAADAGGGGCVRKAGHAGEHAWRTVTAQALDRGEAWRPSEEGMRAAAGLGRELRSKGMDDFRPDAPQRGEQWRPQEKLTTEDVRLPQPGEEWPPVPCGVLFIGPDGDHTVCNVIAGHIGSHQHLPVDLNSDAGEDRPELPVRERRGVTTAALTRLRRELREELQHKLGTLERGVNERLEALEKSMGSREDHLSLHHTLEVGLYSALGEVERRMTALEGRVIDWLNSPAPDQVAEPSPQVTVYGIDVTEWDRRLDTLEKRADQVLERVNKAEYRILRAVESLQAEPMEHARGTVTCDAVGQWRPPTGDDPVAVVCQRVAGHEGGCEDRGMTWPALCADTPVGKPWCIHRPGHDGECDPDPSAQVQPRQR